MKKKIILIGLLFAMVLSFFGCKQPASSDVGKTTEKTAAELAIDLINALPDLNIDLDKTVSANAILMNGEGTPPPVNTVDTLKTKTYDFLEETIDISVDPALFFISVLKNDIAKGQSFSEYFKDTTILDIKPLEEESISFNALGPFFKESYKKWYSNSVNELGSIYIDLKNNAIYINTEYKMICDEPHKVDLFLKYSIKGRKTNIFYHYINDFEAREGILAYTSTTTANIDIAENSASMIMDGDILFDDGGKQKLYLQEDKESAEISLSGYYETQTENVFAEDTAKAYMDVKGSLYQGEYGDSTNNVFLWEESDTSFNVPCGMVATVVDTGKTGTDATKDFSWPTQVKVNVKNYTENPLNTTYSEIKTYIDNKYDDIDEVKCEETSDLREIEKTQLEDIKAKFEEE